MISGDSFLRSRPSRSRRRVLFQTAGALLLSTLLLIPAGCVSRITGRLADGLSGAIADHPDPATVRDGGPAYLLMVDGLLRNDPENANLLRSAAELYATYADAYVDEPERVQTLTERGLDYGLRAVCVSEAAVCGLREMAFSAFESALTETDEGDVPSLFALGAAWAAWIQARRDDWNAVAEISRVEAVMNRVVALDEGYRDGGGHLYLGALATLAPPALGGRPEEGRAHFERAIRLSGGKNLMAKVLFARHYARTVFDRELHDRLLREVLAADPEAEGFALSNRLAKEEAEALLAGSEAYFE
ncbi:MAG: TRAP transporter TatT component family protein [Desulfococcaceae bacterium]